MIPTGIEAEALRVARRGIRISAVAWLGLAGVYVLALGFTPVEARQGLAQKIFYLHVPAAWAAAGHPHAVFPIAPAELARAAGATVIKLAE